jgi:hypothetical protein
MGYKKQKPPYVGVMSVEGLEPSTNGLKGQRFSHASHIQWLAVFH